MVYLFCDSNDHIMLCSQSLFSYLAFFFYWFMTQLITCLVHMAPVKESMTYASFLLYRKDGKNHFVIWLRCRKMPQSMWTNQINCGIYKIWIKQTADGPSFSLQEKKKGGGKEIKLCFFNKKRAKQKQYQHLQLMKHFLQSKTIQIQNIFCSRSVAFSFTLVQYPQGSDPG